MVKQIEQGPETEDKANKIRTEIARKILLKIKGNEKENESLEKQVFKKDDFSKKSFLSYRINYLINNIDYNKIEQAFSNYVDYCKKETLSNFFRLLIDKEPPVNALFLYLKFFKESPVFAIHEDADMQGSTLSTKFMTELYDKFLDTYSIDLKESKHSISFEVVRELICQQLLYLAIIYSHKEQCEFYTEAGALDREARIQHTLRPTTVNYINFYAYFYCSSNVERSIYQKNSIFLECAIKIADQEVNSFVKMYEILTEYTKHPVLAAHREILRSGETGATRHMKKIRDLSSMLNSEQHKKYTDFKEYKENVVKFELMKIISEHGDQQSNNEVDKIKTLFLEDLLKKIEKSDTAQELSTYLALYAVNPILKKDTKNALKNSDNDKESKIIKEIESINISLQNNFKFEKAEPDFKTKKEVITAQLAIFKAFYKKSDKVAKNMFFGECLYKAQKCDSLKELQGLFKEKEYQNEKVSYKDLQTHNGWEFFGGDITTAEFLMLSTEQFVKTLCSKHIELQNGSTKTYSPE